MNDFVRAPLLKKLNRQNMLTRLENVERKTGARQSLRVDGLQGMSENTGELFVDNLSFDPGTMPWEPFVKWLYSYVRMSVAQSDMFYHNEISPFHVEVLGPASGTYITIDSELEHPGIIRFDNAGTANAGARIRLSNNFRLIVQGGEAAECILRPLSGATQSIIVFGFMDSQGTSTITNGIIFHLLGNGGATMNLSRQTNVGGVGAAVTMATIDVDEWLRLRFVVNEDATAVDFYVYDESGELLASDTSTSNIPSGASVLMNLILKAYRTSATATDLVDIDWMSFYSSRVLQR